MTRQYVYKVYVQDCEAFYEYVAIYTCKKCKFKTIKWGTRMEQLNGVMINYIRYHECQPT